ncbi:MAG: DUF389 domain-containing protein [Kofleriaceae bacterium]
MRVTHRFQDYLLTSLGGTPATRVDLVHGMLIPTRGEAAGYWLQLAIATMLATLGLALSSTAVVIGAMLVAPLMKPLVELAMGLATGSAALALRAGIRTVASVTLVVIVAGAITWILPFHEITAELEARTAPSLLDLAIAGACALAAAYATLRVDGDIATTAAGTSVGISLVPPLCACGYGLAIGDFDVARGAALLFTANLTGILAIATVMFVLAGFARVDIAAEEAGFDEVSARRTSVRVGRAWSKLARRRLGPLARIVPPFVLLAIVFVPLKRAVGEIAHRSAVRNGVGELLGSDRRRIVQYTLDQTAAAVIVRAVVVGDAKVASELDLAIRQRLVSLGVYDARVSVWAVPDAASVTALSTRIDHLPPPVVPEPAAQTVEHYTNDVAKLVRELWPKGAGELLRISLDLDHADHILISHLGEPLGASGLLLLASAAKPRTGDLVFTEDALVASEAPPAEGSSWLVRAIDLLARARGTGLRACITVPALVKAARPAPAEALVRGTIDAMVTANTVETQLGDRWRVELARSGCAGRSP